MDYSHATLADIRDRLHNLDPNNPEHIKMYETIRYDYFVAGEGKRAWAYDDATSKPVIPGKKPIGNVTVGIGFNMSESNRREWNIIFKDNPVDFDAVYEGRKKLTFEQIDELFEKSRASRTKIAFNRYKRFWPRLRLNERLMLEDVCFNCPNLIKPGTQFYKNFCAYCETGDVEYLKKAIYEIRHRSNRTNSSGLQKRCEAQAILLSSYKCPLYAKPNAPLMPSSPQPFRVIPGETVVPRGVAV